jgi:hypothetical protein
MFVNKRRFRALTNTNGLKNLSLNEVTNADLRHDRDGNGLHDCLDHLRIALGIFIIRFIKVLVEHSLPSVRRHLPYGCRRAHAPAP